MKSAWLQGFPVCAPVPGCSQLYLYLSLFLSLPGCSSFSLFISLSLSLSLCLSLSTSLLYHDWSGLSDRLPGLTERLLGGINDSVGVLHHTTFQVSQPQLSPLPKESPALRKRWHYWRSRGSSCPLLSSLELNDTKVYGP